MRGACAALVLLVACQPGSVAQPSAPSPSGAASPAATPAPTATLAPSSATCGQVITRDFLLGEDLTCPVEALVAGADGITIDLGGHTLSGPGKGQRNWPNPNLDSVGVKLLGRSKVSVRNGTLTAFSTGVLADRSREIVVEKVDSRLSYYGVYLNESTGSTVRDSVITRNTYGLHLQKSSDNVVTGNQLNRQEYSSPGGYGIYLFQSHRNRVFKNTIDANLNWGIWFSDSKQNLIFHNNVAGNNPQVSDNVGGNQWFDPEKKEGNYWGDYEGRDADGDGIGDTPYPISGPSRQQDSYPFMKPDGWLTKRSQTIDHAPAAPAPAARREVRLVALAGGGVLTAAPDAPAAVSDGVPATSIAIAPDRRTVYALSGHLLVVMDAITGGVRSPRYSIEIPGIVAANRDGKHAIVLGPQGALQVDTTRLAREGFHYAHEPRDVAPSWKHNILFVTTEQGIDVFYLGKGGNVPYTIPLDGPGGALVMNASGTRLYAAAQGAGVVDVVDTEQYTIVERIPVSRDPVALAISSDESTLYVAATDGVSALDVTTHGQRGAVFISGTPVDLGMSPNGDQLYVALDGVERGIAVVSTTDLRRANFVRVDAQLRKILVATY